jgi:hypothetical protein
MKLNDLKRLHLILREIELKENILLTYSTFAPRTTEATFPPRKELPANAIILQEPILVEDYFTFHTCENYLKLFPETKVILSTWLDENISLFNSITDPNFHLLLNKKPVDRGIQNMNMQISSTSNGIQLAKKLNCEFVLKTHTDQGFYSNTALSYLHSLSNGPVDGQGMRLVSTTFNTFLFRKYAVNDQFMFGPMLEMDCYWDLDAEFPQDIEGEDFPPEARLLIRYLKNKGWEFDNSLQQSLEIYRDHFQFANSDNLKLIWRNISNLGLYSFSNGELP